MAWQSGRCSTRPGLAQWYRVTQHARWRSLAEVKRVYPQADLVGDKTVFNIAGNRVRLITYINYPAQIVYIKDILTHAEYDRGDWKR